MSTRTPMISRPSASHLGTAESNVMVLLQRRRLMKPPGITGVELPASADRGSRYSPRPLSAALSCSSVALGVRRAMRTRARDTEL
jgi:hypothetical protein